MWAEHNELLAIMWWYCLYKCCPFDGPLVCEHVSLCICWMSQVIFQRSTEIYLFFSSTLLQDDGQGMNFIHSVIKYICKTNTGI